MKKYLLVICAIGLLVFSVATRATLMYSAEASSTFTLVDSGGLTISAEPGPELPSTMTTGTGVASVDADTQSDATLFTGTPLSQDSAVSGAVSPDGGYSEALVLNSFLVTLENVTDKPITAKFEFFYEWDVSITHSLPGDPLSEAGLASAFFHLSGFAPSGGETLAIDEGAGVFPVADWLFHPLISFEYADVVSPVPMSGSTSVFAYVTVPEMSLDSFSVITDASGAANHISEPHILYLMFTWGVFMFYRSSRQG